MGMFRSVLAELVCLRCGMGAEFEIQFKTGWGNDCLETYREGDRASNIGDGDYAGTANGHCEACRSPEDCVYRDGVVRVSGGVVSLVRMEVVEKADAMMRGTRPAHVVDVRRNGYDTPECPRCPFLYMDTGTCQHPASNLMACHLDPYDEVDNLPDKCPLRDGDTIVRLEIVQADVCTHNTVAGKDGKTFCLDCGKDLG